jgi:hypothetical protein
MEVREEVALRFGTPLPEPFGHFAPELVFRTNSTRIKQAAAAVREYGEPGGVFLVKYGEAQFLRETIRTGEVYIKPASQYADDSLPDAIKADELKTAVETLRYLKKLQILDEPGGKVLGEIPIEDIRGWQVSRSLPMDYYVSCYSRLLAPHLFLAFEAYDACLVIREPGEFLNRLDAAMRARGLGRIWLGNVNYYDPWTPGETSEDQSQIQPLTHKHFRYSFEREFRVAWCPRHPVEALEPMNVYVGSLEGIADLVIL